MIKKINVKLLISKIKEINLEKIKKNIMCACKASDDNPH